MTVEQMTALDLGYAPPFSPVWDPVLVAARKAVTRYARRLDCGRLREPPLGARGRDICGSAAWARPAANDAQPSAANPSRRPTRTRDRRSR